MPSRIAAILLAIAYTAVGATPSTAAQATGVMETSRNERVIEDAPLDVMEPSEQNAAEEDYVPAADRSIGDITRFDVRHGEHRVRFRISAQELVRPVVDDTYEAVFAWVSARTDAGRFHALLMLTNRREDGTRIALIGDKDGRVRRCPGQAGSFDTVRDTVTISLPRHCLHTPRWVQAAASIAYSWPGGGDGDHYVDSAPDQPINGPRSYTRRAWHPRT